MKPDVVFIPKFLTQAEADDLMVRIKTKADFRHNDSAYPGRKRPRLEAWYGSWDYPYGRGTVLEAAAIPDWLKPEFDRVATAGLGTYNAVLINLYRHGKDKVDPHSDDDYGDPFPTIPTLVLGECRPFYLARIIQRTPEVKLDLASKVKYMPGHGDLLVMKGRTNAEWQHWIPKTEKDIGERISLTFRFKETK
jgi:alkylated DNA repair dioxygenase AlkB